MMLSTAARPAPAFSTAAFIPTAACPSLSSPAPTFPTPLSTSFRPLDALFFDEIVISTSFPFDIGKLLLPHPVLLDRQQPQQVDVLPLQLRGQAMELPAQGKDGHRGV